MAVYRRATSETPILSGHWACFQSIMLNDHCHPPRQVTKVSHTTVTFHNGEESRTYGKNRVELFADTEEAAAVYELEKAKYDAIRAAAERITAKFDAKIAAIAPGRP